MLAIITCSGAIRLNSKLFATALMSGVITDSAGYSLPYIPGGNLELSNVVKSDADLILHASAVICRIISGLEILRALHFRQVFATIIIRSPKRWILSPRVGFSFKPANWQKDVVFKGAAGIYDQPPFYRELRRYDGSINTDLKAQKSWQAVAGMDYSFKMFDRPARFTTEAYYKYLTDVDPYDIDNVRIRYFGTNSAKAYAYGIEGRLFGEIVKDAESWVSLGIMRTRENLDNDTYATYYNKAGEHNYFGFKR